MIGLNYSPRKGLLKYSRSHCGKINIPIVYRNIVIMVYATLVRLNIRSLYFNYKFRWA